MAAVGFTFWPDAQLLPTIAPIIDEVDYVEVVPETLWGPGGAPNDYHRIAQALVDAGMPLVAHGVGLDLASTDDEHRAVWLSRWRRDAARLGFRWVSDHLGAVSSNGEPIALPVPAPASFHRLRRSLDQLAAATGAPAAVENSAWYAYPGDALDEPARLTDALGAKHHLVLDLHNLWTNSINLGFDPATWLDRAPLDRVIEVHISGGSWAPAGWTDGRTMRLDSHDGAVPDEVWQLLDDTVTRCPALRGATLEYMEAQVPDSAVDTMLAELRRLREVVRAHGQPLGPPADAPATIDPVTASSPLTATEREMSAALRGLVRRPNANDSVAHRLIVKLRFGRLLRGDQGAAAWFDADPADFTEAFRAFHLQTRCARTPWGEAALWRGWLRGRR